MIEQDLDQLIRRRAYELWEQEERPEGRARIHWLHAEAEFRERFCASASTSDSGSHSLTKSPAENLADVREEGRHRTGDHKAAKAGFDTDQSRPRKTRHT